MTLTTDYKLERKISNFNYLYRCNRIKENPIRRISASGSSGANNYNNYSKSNNNKNIPPINKISEFNELISSIYTFRAKKKAISKSYIKDVNDLIEQTELCVEDAIKTEIEELNENIKQIEFVTYIFTNPYQPIIERNERTK